MFYSYSQATGVAATNTTYGKRGDEHYLEKKPCYFATCPI